MQLTWKTVDNWRGQRGMPVSELARRAGIPERTVYAGVKKDARLRAATAAAVRAIFPDKFDGSGGVTDDAPLAEQVYHKRDVVVIAARGRGLMSGAAGSAILICHGAPVPADGNAVPALILELITEVNAEAARCGWSGAAFERFSSVENYIQFDVVPGERPATIDDLRQFREAQRAQRMDALARQAEQPEQEFALMQAQSVNMNMGVPPELKWIDLDLIFVDESYQRPIKPRRVQQILRDFTWAQFGALMLVARENGRFAVYGDDAVTRACRALREAWSKDNNALNGTMIQALSRIYRNNKRAIDHDRMVLKLKGKDRKILVADAETFRKMGGGDAATNIAKVLVEVYNRGLQKDLIALGVKP